MSHPPNAPGPQGPEDNQQPGAHQAGYGQPPQKKSKKKWVIGCLGLIVLAILLFAGCAAIIAGAGDEEPVETTEEVEAPVEEEVERAEVDAPVEEEEARVEETAPAPTQDDAATETVVLEVTADPSGTVIWGDVGSSNSESVSGTWTREVPAEDDSIYTVSVTGDVMDESSTVSCRILVEGEVVDEASGSGAMGSALCAQPIF